MELSRLKEVHQIVVSNVNKEINEHAEVINERK